jgi:hypothetical protein
MLNRIKSLNSSSYLGGVAETAQLRRGLAERARSVRRGPVHNFSPAFNEKYLVFNHGTSHMQLAGVTIAVRFGLERTSYSGPSRSSGKDG